MMHIDLSPEALLDLEKLEEHISVKFGDSIAKETLRKITDAIQNLARYPDMGMDLTARYDVICDYKYLVANKNYVFFRVDGEAVHVIRVLDERQDFMQILFDSETTSPETADYWDK